MFIECTPLLQLDEGNQVLGQAGKSSHFTTKLNFSKVFLHIGFSKILMRVLDFT